jgi:LPXTG-site transpeptidase (sortase) family protein
VPPGEPGLSVIDGHISGIYNTDGIFQHLDKLKNGDTFTVTLGSGKRLTYSVYDNRSVPVGEAVAALLRQDAGVKSQLNLITCGGQYNKASDSYDHRVIVSAKLVE